MGWEQRKEDLQVLSPCGLPGGGGSSDTRCRNSIGLSCPVQGESRDGAENWGTWTGPQMRDRRPTRGTVLLAEQGVPGLQGRKGSRGDRQVFLGPEGTSCGAIRWGK